MKLLHQEITTCSHCPFYEVEQDQHMMIRVYCMNDNHRRGRLLYSDMNGDSWKAHREIHNSCLLPNKD